MGAPKPHWFSVPELPKTDRMNICPCCKQFHDSTACPTPETYPGGVLIEGGVAAAADCSASTVDECVFRNEDGTCFKSSLRQRCECDNPLPPSETIRTCVAVADIIDERNSAREEVEKLKSAIRAFVTDFERISWGWDGDCGSAALVDHLFSQIEPNTSEQTPT
jgi:hypothetical protein